jgi:hypothetical protein
MGRIVRREEGALMVFSDSIGKRTKDIFFATTNNRWYLTAFGIALFLLLIFSIQRLNKYYFVNALPSGLSGLSSAKQKSINVSQQNNTQSDIKAINDDSVSSNSSSGRGLSGQSVTAAADTETSVNINGVNITASTSGSQPDQSINKTVTDSESTANVSIEQKTAVSGDGQKHTSSNVHVNSNSFSGSNSSIHVDQHTTGGGTD